MNLTRGRHLFFLEFNLHLGHRDDDFGVWELILKLLFKPGGGGGISVDEEDFFGPHVDGKVEELVTVGVAGEIEFIDGAVEWNFMGAIEADEIAGGGFLDLACRSGGISVAYEEKGVERVWEELARKNIGDCFLGHHSTGEAVDGSGFVFDGFPGAFFTSSDDVHVLEDLKTWAGAAGLASEGVIENGHLGTQAANDDGCFLRDDTVHLEAIEHSEDFLGFADGEDGDEDGTSVFQGAFDVVCEAFGFLWFDVSAGSLVDAPGSFHNEDIGLDEIGEAGAFDEGVVVEVDVAGVEDRFFIPLEKDAGGAEDVAGIEEGDLGAFVFIVV